MIEGLICEVTSAELVAHLDARAEYHAVKADAYAGQAQSVRDLGAATPGQSNDPSSSLAQSAETHRNRAAFFSFLADHIVPDETYRLSEQDLIRVEFAARYL